MEKDILPDVVSGVELVTDVNTHVVYHIMVFHDSIEFNWKDHITMCLYIAGSFYTPARYL